MKRWIVAFLLTVQGLSAIPNTVFGGIVNAQSPLDGLDLTGPLIAGLRGGELPGEWKEESSVAGTRSAYLLARPLIWGQEALLVRGLWRDESLEELQITFNDAGSFFGYFSAKAPEHLSKREKEEFFDEQTRVRQEEFTTLHLESLAAIKGELEKLADRGKGKSLRFGKSRAIRAEVTEYQWEGMTARLFHGEERLVRVSLGKKDALSDQWMDRSLADLDARSYRQWLQKRATKEESGDEILKGVEVVPQGYRPYCGLNTLVMAGRYLGMHLDEDWLASAGKFKNTGSAAGSQMLSLYGSVASEAGLKMKRLNRFEETVMKRSLRAGLPVIVWRRWSSNRDREHSRQTHSFKQTGKADWGERSQLVFPDKKAPLHASVIVGFNEERREVLFLESWSERQGVRRMPVEEMKGTAYLTFCFQP